MPRHLLRPDRLRSACTGASGPTHDRDTCPGGALVDRVFTRDARSPRTHP